MEKKIKEEIREEVEQELLPTSTEDTEDTEDTEEDTCSDEDVKIEIPNTKGIFLRKSFFHPQKSY